MRNSNVFKIGIFFVLLVGVFCGELAKQAYCGELRAESCTFLEKYAADASVKQVIIVEQTTLSEGNMFLFVKEENGWQNKLSCRAFLGKKGVGKRKEGDAKTPLGDFMFSMAFGVKKDPGSVIGYTKLTDGMYWCGDWAFYNRFVDTEKTDHWCGGNSEHLIDYTKQYAYALALNYNADCVFGRGSAIFLHCVGNKPYTGGCIAVPENDMITILRAVDKNAHIFICAGDVN